LALIAPEAPIGASIFLTALATAAVLVIAIFYSQGDRVGYAGWNEQQVS
jgi:hypothetical protein